MKNLANNLVYMIDEATPRRPGQATLRQKLSRSRKGEAGAWLLGAAVAALAMISALAFI